MALNAVCSCRGSIGKNWGAKTESSTLDVHSHSSQNLSPNFLLTIINLTEESVELFKIFPGIQNSSYSLGYFGVILGVKYYYIDKKTESNTLDVHFSQFLL